MRDLPGAIDASVDLKVSYLCLEQSREGSAANAHIVGFFSEWPSSSVRVTRARHASSDALFLKVCSLLAAFAAFARSLSGRNMAGARAHPAVLPALLFAKLMGKKTFLFLQGRPSDLPADSFAYRLVGQLGELSFRGALRAADVVFATSDGLAEWARAETSAPIHRVTNGVDVDRFPWPVEDRRGVIFVGTPAPWQGLDTLIEATRLPEWPQDVPLTVIGVTREDYHGEVGNHVRFRGRLSPVEVAQELSEHAIGVSPKRLDQATMMGVSPFKLAEYHGAGLAVLASDVPGQSDMLRNSDGGELFPPDDPGALALVVNRLMKDAEAIQTQQTNARAYAENHLTWAVQRRAIMRALRAHQR
ncbi:glycosyltransferase family 4 protein [Terrabacter sp. 2RAF25]|uniref:glycosyltransferase family 4 protein n=1 Tax=Terrabacter sp. 2RAF25 TaxID=3232998 RepID=UPI003F94C7CF